MQITIDTQRDSKEELRKTAKFLLNLAGDESYGSESQNGSSPDASPAMFSMFGDDSSNSDDKKDDNFGHSGYNDSDSTSSGTDDEDKKPPRIEIIDY